MPNVTCSTPTRRPGPASHADFRFNPMTNDQSSRVHTLDRHGRSDHIRHGSVRRPVQSEKSRFGEIGVARRVEDHAGRSTLGSARALLSRHRGRARFPMKMQANPGNPARPDRFERPWYIGRLGVDRRSPARMAKRSSDPGRPQIVARNTKRSRSHDRARRRPAPRD